MKARKGDNDYLSMKLDDVGVGDPVNAALVILGGEPTPVRSRRTAKAD